MAEGAHSAAAIFLRNKGSENAGFFGNAVEAAPLFRGKSADNAHNSFGDTPGSAIIHAFLGRVSQILGFQGDAFVPHYLAHHIFEAVNFRGKPWLHQTTPK